MRKTSRVKLLVRSLTLLCFFPIRSFGDTLSWHTGDPNYASAATVGLTNGVTDYGQANVYELFIAPSGGWLVTSVFINTSLQSSTVVSQANWQIRSALSNGNGGTMIASGTSAATQAVEYTGSNNAVDEVQVNHLSIDLARGEYWLSVAPVTTGTDDFPATLRGPNIRRLSARLSMGIFTGPVPVAAPEQSSLALLALGLIAPLLRKLA